MLEFIAAHRPPRPTRLSLERRIEELELIRRMPQQAGSWPDGVLNKTPWQLAWMRSLTGCGWAAPPCCGFHNCNSTTTGGASSSRWLGCAPKIVARIHPCIET